MPRLSICLRNAPIWYLQNLERICYVLCMETLIRLNQLQKSFEEKAAHYSKKGDRLSASFYRRVAQNADRLSRTTRDRIHNGVKPVRQFWLS